MQKLPPKDKDKSKCKNCKVNHGSCECPDKKCYWPGCDGIEFTSAEERKTHFITNHGKSGQLKGQPSNPRRNGGGGGAGGRGNGKDTPKTGAPRIVSFAGQDITHSADSDSDSY